MTMDAQVFLIVPKYPYFSLFSILCSLLLSHRSLYLLLASGNIHQLQGTVASAALFGAIVGQLVGARIVSYDSLPCNTEKMIRQVD